MKKTLFLFLTFLVIGTSSSAADKWPAPQGYVNDFAHVIPADQSQTLESFLAMVEQKTGAQIAVVTTPSVEGGDIDGAAAELFKTWGIGKKGKDNGVLILASIQDRRLRIEVGYSLEAVITDGQTGTIRRDYMNPYFKQGNYGQGLINGAAALAQLIAVSEGVTLNGQEPVAADQGGQLSGVQVIFILIILVVFILLRIFGGFWGGGYYGGGWGGGGFGGGGGGGFGGFGGGGSGGGGSSGSW